MRNRPYQYGFRNHPGGWWQRHPSNTPPVNIEETESGYTITAFAPSLVKENISITTKNDILCIHYRSKDTGSEAQFTHREYTGNFERSFDLKGKVDVDHIEARYADGELRILLPKTDAAKRPSKDVPVS